MRNPIFGSGLRPMSVALIALTGLAACDGGFDLDLRHRIGDNFSTASAATAVTAKRPDPDDRGIISYPNYQVAVAKRGDTLSTLANRVGLPVEELAQYNGINPEDELRKGEIIALPRRVSEPSPDTGAVGTGPILPPDEVDVTELASAAIEDSAPTPPTVIEEPEPQTGIEPIRHKVERGETAYTIARLYKVSVKSLAEWNSLDREFTIREGQFLLIPVVLEEAPEVVTPVVEDSTPAPGEGSPTPEPPSASTPLPEETPEPAAKKNDTVVAQDLGQQQTAASADKAEMVMPVQGRIIREFTKGGNEGIDITASAGSPVRAAASGLVAAITTDADNVPIVVVKHPDNVLTVYINLGDIKVQKDDRVSRGQQIGALRPGSPPYLHFEVRRGFDSVDPMEFLQ
jgi:murein DD-endopeptidase MepM/ murein hydrolase activator NlpD